MRSLAGTALAGHGGGRRGRGVDEGFLEEGHLAAISAAVAVILGAPAGVVSVKEIRCDTRSDARQGGSAWPPLWALAGRQGLMGSRRALQGMRRR